MHDLGIGLFINRYSLVCQFNALSTPMQHLRQFNALSTPMQHLHYPYLFKTTHIT
ncbi:hypothetical protein C7B70_19725 [Chlorogloea sp. CCALA 695]|nr:hypothetical protein C7B70_19725 [Chlorogloea sp. CCALA 695]